MAHLHDGKVKRLELVANRLREHVIDMVATAGSGHQGGPLGMADVAFTTAEAERFADRAAPHDRAGKPTDIHPFREPNPAGSLHATTRGLAAWLKFHLADGVTPDGKRLVSVASLHETRRPHTPMPLDDPGIGPTYPDAVQVSYGLGWVVFDRRGSPVLAHGGQIGSDTTRWA